MCKGFLSPLVAFKIFFLLSLVCKALIICLEQISLISSLWYSFSFLNLQVYIFQQIWRVFSHYFKHFFSQALFFPTRTLMTQMLGLLLKSHKSLTLYSFFFSKDFPQCSISLNFLNGLIQLVRKFIIILQKRQHIVQTLLIFLFLFNNSSQTNYPSHIVEQYSLFILLFKQLQSIPLN